MSRILSLLVFCGWLCCAVIASGQEPAVPSLTPPRSTGVEVPPYHLTRVELDGEVKEDRAALRIMIDLSVNHGEGWHDVPLRLGQAHIWRHAYTGSGNEAPGVSGVSDEGLIWRIRGIGRHQLTFDAWVPVRRIPGGAQLQLSLPPLPTQFEAKVALRIPESPLMLRSSRENTTILVQREEEGTTWLEAGVSGGRLDLSWHPSVVTPGALTQVRSLWTVIPHADRVELGVDQTLQFEAGTFTDLIVQAPPGFIVIDVAGPTVQQWRSVENRPGWYQVLLDAGMQDRAEIRWTLERPQLIAGDDLILEGFDFERGLRQTGQLRIETGSGTRLLADLDRSRFVQRSDAKGTASPTPTGTTIIYDYSRQPFRLLLQTAPVVTITSVRPHFALYAEDDYFDLSTMLQINVEAGQIEELRIKLPASAGQRWRDWQMMEADEGSTGTLAVGEDELRIRWSAPRRGRFVVHLAARLPRPADAPIPFPMQLPQPEALFLLPARLELSAVDHLELLPAENDNLIRPRNAEPGNPAEPGQELYVVTDLQQPLPLVVESHDRTVAATTQVRIGALHDTGIDVSQQIALQIRFGRVAVLGLTYPEQFRRQNPSFAQNAAVEVWFNDQRLATNPTPEGVKVSFPQPVTGDISLDLRFRWPLTVPRGRSATAAAVPVIRLEGISYGNVSCQITPIEQLQVAEGASWGAVRTSPTGATWAAGTTEVAEVPLIISGRANQATQRCIVERAAYWSRIERDGSSETRTLFQLDSLPERLTLQLPRGLPRNGLREIRLDGEVLPAGEWEFQEAQPPEIRFQFASPRSSPARLSVIYRLPEANPLALATSLELEFPTFSESIWVNESDWEILLPAGQHLLVYPHGLTPRFSWQRRGVIWHRLADASYLQERRAIWAATAGEQSLLTDQLGYPFRTYGRLVRVEMWTMSQSLILLVGAGTSLLLGFWFWSFPQTRNMLSIMLLAFLFSLASLWYLEAIQLLLQPALIGLLLAGLASLLDSRFRSQQPAAVPPVVMPPAAAARRSGSSMIHPPVVAESPAPVGAATEAEPATQIPSTIYRPGMNIGD